MRVFCSSVVFRTKYATEPADLIRIVSKGQKSSKPTVKSKSSLLQKISKRKFSSPNNIYPICRKY